MEENNNVIELQLHDDERTPVSRKRYRSNDAKTKLDAIIWSRDHSIKSAAKKFHVSRGCIQAWREQERELEKQV